jgi:hypothetical protein
MQFVLSHRHAPHECGVAFAAWRGFESPLRHTSTLASCSTNGADQGEHLLIWTVDAASSEQALALLPPWLADRAEVRRVGEVSIP